MTLFFLCNLALHTVVEDLVVSSSLIQPRRSRIYLVRVHLRSRSILVRLLLTSRSGSRCYIRLREFYALPSSLVDVVIGWAGIRTRISVFRAAV